MLFLSDLDLPWMQHFTELRGQNRWMLTSAAFIVINSIRAVSFINKSIKVENESCSNKCSSPASYMQNAAPLDLVSSGLISELVKCLDFKPMRFHCRAVAIHILVLEKKFRNVNYQHKNHFRPYLVDIPLAGFVLDGIWQFIHSNENKPTEHGYWRAKGEACRIFPNSSMTGWRAIIEFYQGQSPHESKTNWVMQEYWITQKKLSQDSKPKEARSPCRVFCGDEQKPNCKKLQKMVSSDSAVLVTQHIQLFHVLRILLVTVHKQASGEQG